SAGAGDAGARQHRSGNPDLAPRAVRDALALAVGLGDLDERLLERGDVHGVAHRLELGRQITPFLHELQLVDRTRRGKLLVDAIETLGDRFRRALATALGLRGAQCLEVVAHGATFGTSLFEGTLVLIRHRTGTSL